nr:EOG090X0BI6 [Sida crystallina]
MGRTIIAEDGIEYYGTALAEKKELIVGLIFGQEFSAQKSCVIHLSRTPEPNVEDNDDSEDVNTPSKRNSSKTQKTTKAVEDFDDSLILDHVRQVMRTLPGGINVLGLFMVSDSDPFQNSGLNNRFRKLLTSIDGIISKNSITIRQQLTCERIVLHISNVSMKYTAKTIDIASPIASPKPAEWKFVGAAGSPWIELHCTLNVEFFITLSEIESSGTLRNQVEAGLEHYNKAVKQCVCIIEGNLPSDSDLLIPVENAPEKGSGKKKQKQAEIEERIKTLNIQVLIPEPEVKFEKQKTTAELRFGGQMCIKAYIHSKATVREAYQVIREDITRSLWARCDMHCDSLIGDEQRGQPHVRAVLHEPPRRVLAPLPYSPISISDYLFPGEGPADSLTSLADLLDLGTLLDGDIQDYWEAAAEVSDALESDRNVLETTTTSTKQPSLQTPSNSRVILLSALIAMLAVILSYLALQVVRSE